MKPLILNAHGFSPNPIKITMAIEALRLPYELRLWSLDDNPENGVKGAKFLKINEHGRLPTLQDPNTGLVIFESGAIMNYILRKYDTSGLLGPNGDSDVAKIEYDKWEYFLATSLAPMNGQANFYKSVCLFRTIAHPLVFALMHRCRNNQNNPEALQRFQAQTYWCYDVLNEQLGRTGAGSILPGGVTAIDYHCEPWLRTHESGGLSLERYPNLAKWLKNMESRPEVKATYDKFKTANEKFKARV